MTDATHTEIIARAVISHGGKILLARERGSAFSFLPGGHVKPGEHIERALVRELAEELGTSAQVRGFVGAVEHDYVHDGVRHHELNIVFDVIISDDDPCSQEDHLEFTWLPFDDLSIADVRPRTLKAALLAGGGSGKSFWRAAR